MDVVLKRKMLDYLRKWKASHGKECLLIDGARQVGKSFIVDAFGNADYESFIQLDFVKQPELKEIFSGPLDPDEIYSRMTLLVPKIRFVPKSTLIFLDEIQECPQARSAFKYLALDGRYDVVGSGSLLGIRFRELVDAPSLPVGYERHVTMRPLDFEEFLWARGYDEEALALLRGYLDRMEAVPSAIHETMMRHLREYLAVGGMPATVRAFAFGGDYGSAHESQEMLHALYLDDIARYAAPSERVKARACYLSLPRQLAKENTKFRYATVEKGAGSRKFEASIDWIVGAEIVLPCKAVSTPRFPLASYEEESRFRLYANDTGMLMAMYDFKMKAAVVDNTLAGPMKGGLYENLVACMLAQKGAVLRYWMSQNAKHEIEFLVDGDASVVPVEVKAGRGATASLDAVLEREDVRLGYKLVDGNVGRAGKKVTLPLYMAMFLFE